MPEPLTANNPMSSLYHRPDPHAGEYPLMAPTNWAAQQQAPVNKGEARHQGGGLAANWQAGALPTQKAQIRGVESAERGPKPAGKDGLYTNGG